MKKLILLSALFATWTSIAQPPPQQLQPQFYEYRYPLVNEAGVSATTTTARAYYAGGKPHRVRGYAISGTYNATWTVYGTDEPCGGSCEAADGTSLGTITTDGGTLDVSGDLYIFALVTSYASGTIRADVSPLETSGAASAPSGVSVSLGSAVTGTGAQTAVQGRSPASIYVEGTTSAGAGSATVYIQVSNTGTSYETACTLTLTLSTTASGKGCSFAVPWRYIRMNVNAISGTDATLAGSVGG